MTTWKCDEKYVKREIPKMYTNDTNSENIEGNVTKYRRTKLGVSARDKQNIPVYVGTLCFFFNRMINKVARFPKTPAMQRVVAVTKKALYWGLFPELFPGSRVVVCSEMFCSELINAL
jgi:hypothetical protein